MLNEGGADIGHHRVESSSYVVRVMHSVDGRASLAGEGGEGGGCVGETVNRCAS